MGYLDELNEAQRAAVLKTEGPLMIVAGAGSGKTRVLTYRIAHLIAQGTDPFQILALTFTNKAAREMKERITRIVGDGEAKNIWMGTFHSVFARILRSEAEYLGFPRNFTIYDTQDSRNVITQVIKDLKLDTDVYKPKILQARISALKNALITLKRYDQNPEVQEQDNASRRPKTRDIYHAYVDRCFRAGAMDFDDLLLRTNELFHRFPDVLHKYQLRFRFLLVDEYQDTNHAQYLIVKSLASRNENLCVVGDDAQSIYAFRGANIRNILNFKKDYPDAAVMKLEQNYRSTKRIVNAANSIIKNNKDQIQKDVWTDNAVGEKIVVYRADTDSGEGSWVANTIMEKQLRDREGFGGFAILYRTNAQSRSFEESFRRLNIPYRIYGGVSFYQRKEVKDLLAYLKFIVNPADDEALRRIINYPKRGIGKTTIEKLTVAANGHGISLWKIMSDAQAMMHSGLNAGTIRKIQEFVTMIESFRALESSYDAFELTEHVAKSSGILRELGGDKSPEGISRWENIQELINGVRDFTERQKELAEDNDSSLAFFLQEVSLLTDADEEDPDDTNKVSLMTIHLAKGLEFPNVFIVGLEEDLFPSMMAMNTREDLEEERRLFYVALTRAEENAFLTFAQTRYRWGKLVANEPSRFLEEIEDRHLDLQIPKFRSFDRERPKQSSTERRTFERKSERSSTPSAPPAHMKKVSANTSGNSKSLDLQTGDKVEHDKFGKGVVIQLEGDPGNKKATINFEGVGPKKLLLKFAKLRLV
jgi:DNA helicase-2/ATP-dependent DNA helicase PcrA